MRSLRSSSGRTWLTKAHALGLAAPDAIQSAPGLPRTRSGKIAASDAEGLGDSSTLADPAVIEKLIVNRVD